jgi:hypothetical protein
MGFYRVVRTGISVFGMPNLTKVSNSISLLLEAGYTNGSLLSVSVVPSTGTLGSPASVSAPFPYVLSVTVDTRYLPNGTLQLIPEGTWTVPTTDPFFSPFVKVSGTNRSVIVSNFISYPNWNTDVADDLMLIRVGCAKTNGDWEVDVFGSALDYIGTFAGHSASGEIYFGWNLYDSSGNYRNDLVF